jgi:hypothetical protein
VITLERLGHDNSRAMCRYLPWWKWGWGLGEGRGAPVSFGLVPVSMAGTATFLYFFVYL